jgi:hypothetical protein
MRKLCKIAVVHTAGLSLTVACVNGFSAQAKLSVFKHEIRKLECDPVKGKRCVQISTRVQKSCEIFLKSEINFALSNRHATSFPGCSKQERGFTHASLAGIELLKLCNQNSDINQQAASFGEAFSSFKLF